MAAEGAKLITVIVPQGQGMALLHALYERKQLRASLGTARAPVTTVRRRGGIARTHNHSVEKDIVQVVVGVEDAGGVFELLYDKAGIGERYGGFMFQGSVARVSPFGLPEGLPQG
jgi:hypothetical protein